MTAFSESPEYMEESNPLIVVRALYRGLLRREPDRSGFEFWATEYRSGRSLERMIAGFLASEEYGNRFWIEDRAPAALTSDDLITLWRARRAPHRRCCSTPVIAEWSKAGDGHDRPGRGWLRKLGAAVDACLRIRP